MHPTQAMIDDALRFMRVPLNQRSGELAEQVRRTFEELEGVVRPRGVSRRFPLELLADGLGVAVAGFTIQSRDLARLLAQSSECCLMAVTLGSEVDRAILRAQARDMLGGVMLDACASVRADALCDEEEGKIAGDLKEGEHLTMRFSPGYGDAPLQASADVIAVLDATRRIGLAMTKRFMMTPVKSVTAIIGVSLQDTDRTRGCGTCSGRETCPYRKKGEGCGL